MLSIVIPCMEDDILLFPTLKSIFMNKFNPKSFEVLLICSESSRISEKVREFPIQLFSVTFRSQARALNWSLERTNGDIICITKPGCVVESNWLSKIARFLSHNRGVDGVGGPILPCWEHGTRLQKLASQIFHEEQGFPKRKAVLKPGSRWGLLHATNSAFRKDVLASMEFDESFNYDYDFDICWKMLKRGHRLVYNSEIKVRYIFPSGIHQLLNRYYWWGKEKVILRKKYFQDVNFKWSFYAPYNTFRSLLEPSSLVSRKKLLRLVQHVAFNLGCVRGYSARA